MERAPARDREPVGNADPQRARAAHLAITISCEPPFRCHAGFTIQTNRLPEPFRSLGSQAERIVPPCVDGERADKPTADGERRMILKRWMLMMAVLSVPITAPALACERFPQDLGASFHEETLRNGLYLVEFDRDGDGRPDYAVLFQIIGSSREGAVTDTLPQPLFYWIDTNNGGDYNETWVDREGKGRCQDIVKYWARRN